MIMAATKILLFLHAVLGVTVGLILLGHHGMPPKSYSLRLPASGLLINAGNGAEHIFSKVGVEFNIIGLSIDYIPEQ
jgi:hypothetical protein